MNYGLHAAFNVHIGADNKFMTSNCRRCDEVEDGTGRESCGAPDRGDTQTHPGSPFKTSQVNES